MRPLGGVGYLALALGILVLLGLATASAWLSARNHEALDSVSRKRASLNSIEAVSTALDEAETGQRGFLLTGKEAYLRPFQRAAETLPAAMSSLEGGIAADPEAAKLLRDLVPFVVDKLAELRETLDLARAGQTSAAIALVQTDRGQRDMDAIRSLTSRLGSIEESVVAAQFAAVNERGRLLVLMDAAGLAGVLLLAVFIAYGVRRHLTLLRDAQDQLESANRELATSNANLDRTVGARTADLTEANEEIQRFAYIVSHDLRAPLVNIMGFTSELETAAQALGRFAGKVEALQPGAMTPEVEAAVDDDIPEAIRFIRASTAKMDRLIGAILTLSREGRRMLTPERLDMREVLQGIADSVRHQAAGCNAEILVGAVPELMADRVAVEQIFGNLLDNALKYLEPGRPGVVRIDGHVDGRLAVFEVRDNGRGIAPRDRERIFELFRRAGDQSVPGEGIGLAHVRALVRRMGGKIECQSVPHEGTVFRVRLPASTSVAASPHPRSVAA